jgi:Uma2 family endonuclease
MSIGLEPQNPVSRREPLVDDFNHDQDSRPIREGIRGRHDTVPRGDGAGLTSSENGAYKNGSENGENGEVDIYPPPDDPFFYGYRYVEMQNNGEEISEMVPLTLEDVLHPQLEDYASQNEIHALFCTYLYITLRTRFRHDPSFVVLQDVPINWGMKKIGDHCPDVSVFHNVHTHYPYGVFKKKEYGGEPLLLIEVTSPSTRILDVDSKRRKENKYRQYARVGVPWYLIIDTVGWKDHTTHPPLMLYRLKPNRRQYEPVKPDERDWLWVEPVRLFLGPRNDGPLGLAWYEEDGTMLLDHGELADRAAEAEARAAKAEARLRELETELQRKQNENTGNSLSPGEESV